MADLQDIINGEWSGTNVDQSGTAYQVTADLTLNLVNQRIDARITYPTGLVQTIAGTIDTISPSTIEYSWRLLLRRGKGRWTRIDDSHVTGSWGNQTSFTDLGSFQVEKLVSQTIVLKDAFGAPVAFASAVSYVVFDGSGATLRSATLQPGATMPVDFTGIPDRIVIRAPDGYSAYYVEPLAVP